MPYPDYNTPEEQEMIRKGGEIARILQLKIARNEFGKRYVPERYDTKHGTKTALGVYRTLEPFFRGINLENTWRSLTIC